VIATLVLLAAAALVLVRRPRTRDRIAGTFERVCGRERWSAVGQRVRDGVGELREVRLSRIRSLRCALAAILNWISDCGCLVFAILAVGGHVPWQGVLAAYGLTLAAVLPITPWRYWRGGGNAVSANDRLPHPGQHRDRGRHALPDHQLLDPHPGRLGNRCGSAGDATQSSATGRVQRSSRGRPTRGNVANVGPGTGLSRSRELRHLLGVAAFSPARLRTCVLCDGPTSAHKHRSVRGYPVIATMPSSAILMRPVQSGRGSTKSGRSRS
jgi:lysylphosphatidylglycerol synthase-like protein